MTARDDLYAALEKARQYAADALATPGTPFPTWRVIITDSESPDGIAPVCTAPGSLHMIDSPDDPVRDEGGVYDCCPWPQIETWSVPLAAYLVALLNADVPSQPTRADVLREAEARLRARAGELSDLADERMSRALEERAQEWHDAANTVAALAAEPTPQPENGPEPEASLDRLAAWMRRSQHWRGDRLVSERTIGQREIRHLTGIPLTKPAEHEYQFCGADLGRMEWPFTCYRRVAHDGPCGPVPDEDLPPRPEAVVPAPGTPTGGDTA
ncbi:hypothetical protein ACWEFL_02590 [Streptomyces sp. NPDC004838]